jgi:hypothetical protein
MNLWNSSNVLIGSQTRQSFTAILAKTSERWKRLTGSRPGGLGYKRGSPPCTAISSSGEVLFFAHLRRSTHRSAHRYEFTDFWRSMIRLMIFFYDKYFPLQIPFSVGRGVHHAWIHRCVNRFTNRPTILWQIYAFAAVGCVLHCNVSADEASLLCSLE